MNKTVKPILILIAIAVVAYLLVSKVFSGTEEQKTEAKGGGGPMAQKVAVDVFVVSPSAYQNKITSTGTVLPNEDVELRSEITGRVTNINFEEGARVKKGQLLLTVNDAEMRAQLQKLQSNQKLYSDMEARQRTLLEKEYISAQEYDQVSNQLATATADIQALKATLAKAYIRAPFDGVIGLRQVSEGSYVTASTPIARVVDISPVKIEFSVPGRYSQMVKEGDEITFTSEGSAERYKARIYAIQPNIDPTTRTMQVRALYENKDESMKPGGFVRVELPLKEMEEAILIPTEAIIPEASGQKVFLARSGKAVPTMVKIGQRSETLIQILEGIAPGDTIIRSGILQVRPGSELNIRQVTETGK
ncbi:efflux RND transporter periplasmic adaptor subunit [Pontibacter akesuensis]|uniref:Membrane fusion protein, multidrug efflux system n=1 Tax=Pontibacter akesuensis TaxID=388950 RepID=A0A1I7JZ25_9BACT|nr:efflux RND transporter periplasmic adaptor subunit [Pontibacter akesuensis]GHA76392.1 MexH family multidrug efflux RND transporter periplasmic adaptor subunit [Pontibacter akesuensis]SFU90444.1 membrane fusion protein, multidrug efflux system [Pontibacter akesuensis]